MVVCIPWEAVTEIDLDGVFDEPRQVTYLGKAVKMDGGLWRCLANVAGALCLVELRISFDPRDRPL
jgi:hypothetical protein